MDDGAGRAAVLRDVDVIAVAVRVDGGLERFGLALRVLGLMPRSKYAMQTRRKSVLLKKWTCPVATRPAAIDDPTYAAIAVLPET